MFQRAIWGPPPETRHTSLLLAQLDFEKNSLCCRCPDIRINPSVTLPIVSDPKKVMAASRTVAMGIIFNKGPSMMGKAELIAEDTEAQDHVGALWKVNN
jgi:hypothetical protein